MWDLFVVVFQMTCQLVGAWILGGRIGRGLGNLWDYCRRGK